MSLDFRRIDDCISDAELITKEHLKPLFEKLRSLNSEVRDKQIEYLNKVLEWRDERLEEMIRENKALGYRVSELEDKIIELNGR